MIFCITAVLWFLLDNVRVSYHSLQWTLALKQFLVFTWRQKKLKLKIFSFYLYQVKAIFEHLLACLQLGRPLCFENRTWFFSQCMTLALFLGNMLRARKYPFALCFWVLSNQYVERSAYANVFKFTRKNERFERGKLNSRCFHWFCGLLQVVITDTFQPSATLLSSPQFESTLRNKG